MGGSAETWAAKEHKDRIDVCAVYVFFRGLFSDGRHRFLGTPSMALPGWL